MENINENGGGKMNKKELLAVASLLGEAKKCKKLIEQGVDVNVKDVFGMTPLHHFSEYGNLELVKLLIKKGADVNAKNEFGSTPLHYAITYRHFEIAKLLIKKGADVNAKNDLGFTPLHYAVSDYPTVSDYSTLKIIAKIINLLIENGADVNELYRTPWFRLNKTAIDGVLKKARSWQVRK